MLAGCGADATVSRTLDLGPMRWDDGHWAASLDTGPLGVGCVRLTLVVDGSRVGAAAVSIVDGGVGRYAVAPGIRGSRGR